MEGRKLLQFYTVSGLVKVVSLAEFAEKVPVQMVLDPERMQVYQLPPVAPASYEPNFPADLIEYDRKDLKAQTVLEIPHHKIMQEYDKDLYLQIKNELKNSTNAFIERRLKEYVIKKFPDFTVGDLNMNVVEDLSMKYAENFGSQEAYGFPVIFSKYQQYYVISDVEAFKMFLSDRIQNVMKSTTEHRGELAEMAPHKWVTGRYENLTYLRELSAMRMNLIAYEGGTDGR